MSDTTEIRKGEEIDRQRLKKYLNSSLDGEFTVLEISQFPAGSSNLTYCVKLDDEEFVLRRPPFGNRVKTAHDMKREFDVLTGLSKVYRPAPKPLIYCADEAVIGSEFYLMERRRGLIVRGKWPFDKDRVSRRDAAKAFIGNLAELHAVDYDSAGLSELGKPEGYTKRQVEGWSKRYFNAKTDEWAALEKSISWLNERIPDDDGAAMVHNDYKFDNVMLDTVDPAKIIAVLDWEMATIGSPLMDLGTTLGYWMSKESGEELMSMPFNPRILMEEISRDELTEMYGEISGRCIENVDYYYVFGTVKIAVIAQQIYYRYAKGLTADPRFASFNNFVGALGRIALKAIDGSEKG